MASAQSADMASTQSRGNGSGEPLVEESHLSSAITPLSPTGVDVSTIANNAPRTPFHEEQNREYRPPWHSHPSRILPQRHSHAPQSFESSLEQLNEVLRAPIVRPGTYTLPFEASSSASAPAGIPHMPAMLTQRSGQRPPVPPLQIPQMPAGYAAADHRHGLADLSTTLPPLPIRHQSQPFPHAIPSPQMPPSAPMSPLLSQRVSELLAQDVQQPVTSRPMPASEDELFGLSSHAHHDENVDVAPEQSYLIPPLRFSQPFMPNLDNLPVPPLRLDEDAQGDNLNSLAVHSQGDNHDSLAVHSSSVHVPANPRKRLRPLTPTPAEDASPKAGHEDEESDDDAQNCCTICYEPWERNGDHRLVCLPCGHLLGQSCAKEWLNLRKICPMCKRRATYKQVRVIFGAPAKLRVVEHVELDKLRDQLTKEKDDHKATQLKYQELKKQMKSCKTQLAALERAEMARSRARVGSVGESTSRRQSIPKPSSSNDGAGLVRNSASVGLSMNGSSSSSAASSFSTLSMLYECGTAGESSAFAFDDAGSIVFNEKYAGRGNMARLRRVSLAAPGSGVCSTVPMCGVNQVAIRSSIDGDNSIYNRFIAVVSFDRTLRILSPDFNEAIVFNLPTPALSCSWVPSQPHLVVVGAQGGQVAAYDLRSITSGPLYTSAVSAGLGARPSAVHSLSALRGINGAPSGAMLAANQSRVGMLMFGGLAGGMSFVPLPAPSSCFTGASSFGRYIVLSSRSAQGDIPASLTVHDRILSSNVPSFGGLEPSAADQPVVNPWTLGPNVCGTPLTGHVQNTRAFNPATAVSIPCGRPVVLSGDDQSYGGRPGGRIWQPSQSGRWISGELNYDIGGHVRCVQAIDPPRSVSPAPFLGMISANRLLIMKTHST